MKCPSLNGTEFLQPFRKALVSRLGMLDYFRNFNFSLNLSPHREIEVGTEFPSVDPAFKKLMFEQISVTDVFCSLN
jgi:hypothetical protein